MSRIPSPNDLRLLSRGTSPLAPRLVVVRGRRAGRFLKGPIPWPWLCRAAQLPGRALHVAVAIRLWTGIKKTNDIVLPTSTLLEMGVDRHAALRGVRALERAGLLVATRHVGRKTRVCLIEVVEAPELPNLLPHRGVGNNGDGL